MKVKWTTINPHFAPFQNLSESCQWIWLYQTEQNFKLTSYIVVCIWIFTIGMIKCSVFVHDLFTFHLKGPDFMSIGRSIKLLSKSLLNVLSKPPISSSWSHLIKYHKASLPLPVGHQPLCLGLPVQFSTDRPIKPGSFCPTRMHRADWLLLFLGFFL